MTRSLLTLCLMLAACNTAGQRTQPHDQPQASATPSTTATVSHTQSTEPAVTPPPSPSAQPTVSPPLSTAGRYVEEHTCEQKGRFAWDYQVTIGSTPRVWIWCIYSSDVGGSGSWQDKAGSLTTTFEVETDGHIVGNCEWWEDSRGEPVGPVCAKQILIAE